MDPPIPRGTLTLVVDASVLFTAALGESGAADLPDDELVAPPLAWSEAASALHESSWRGQRSPELSREALRRLEGLPVAARSPRALRAEAWRVADALGWAKTYDAEYLALAALLGCGIATLDRGMRGGAERLGIAVRAV